MFSLSTQLSLRTKCGIQGAQEVSVNKYTTLCPSVSPLHLAARSGLKKAVQELLSRGANVQTVDENGRVNLVPPSCFIGPSCMQWPLVSVNVFILSSMKLTNE